MANKNKKPEEVIPPVDNTINPEEIESFGSNEAILTHEELEKEKAVEKPKEKKKIKPKGPIDIKFECPFAPLGEAKTVIRFKNPNNAKKDLTFEIPLENKIYTMPKNLSDDEKKLLRAALLENGFQDVTKIEAGIVYNKEKQKYTYTVIHPDHSEQSPVNGNISLGMIDSANKPICGKDGKQIFSQVQIVNGLVKTDDVQIYEALLRAGFYSGHKKVRV